MHKFRRSDLRFGSDPGLSKIRFIFFRLAAISIFSIAFLLSFNCTTTNVIRIASTDRPLHAVLIVKEVHTKPCITLYGGSCSYQEGAIVLRRGFSERELSSKCLITKAGVPDGDITTNVTPAGERIAYRCGKKENWHVIYLGSENRAFLDCKDYNIFGNFVWEGIPAFREAAPAMMTRQCPVMFDDLAAEIRGSIGASAVTDLLIATVSVRAPRGISMDNLQAWDDEYLKLSASEKKRLVPVFRDALLGDSAVLALERSLRYADFSDPEYLPAMKARMQKIVNSPPHYETDSSADMMLRMIARSDAQEGARLGCREIERELKRGATAYLAGAILAVASAGYSCPAVLAALENSRCDAAFYCPRGQNSHICEASELAGDIKKALEGPARALDFNMRDRALLAAALPLSESQAILRLWQERHSYTIDQPREPSCEKLYISGRKGVPCHCFDALPASACSKKNNVELTCLYRVDDTAKKIDQIVSP